MEITYGHRIHSMQDEYVKLARDATVETVIAGSPGSMLVDFFPICEQQHASGLPRTRAFSSCALTVFACSEGDPRLGPRRRLQAQRVQGPRPGSRTHGHALQHGQDRPGTSPPLRAFVRARQLTAPASQASGNARPCFTASLLEDVYARNGITPEEEEDIKGAAGVIYAGSSLSRIQTAHPS